MHCMHVHNLIHRGSCSKGTHSKSTPQVHLMHSEGGGANGEGRGGGQHITVVIQSTRKTAEDKSRGKQLKSAFLAPVKGETASTNLLLSVLQCRAGELALLQQSTAFSKWLVISTSAARPYYSLSRALQLQYVLGHALNPASNIVTATQPLLPAGQKLHHKPRNVATTLR